MAADKLRVFFCARSAVFKAGIMVAIEAWAGSGVATLGGSRGRGKLRSRVEGVCRLRNQSVTNLDLHNVSQTCLALWTESSANSKCFGSARFATAPSSAMHTYAGTFGAVDRLRCRWEEMRFVPGRNGLA